MKILEYIAEYNDSIIVLIVLFFIIISLYKELIGTALTFVIAIVVLGLTGILTPEEMISGFSNSQIAVILMLLFLGEVIRQHSIIEIILDRVFSRAKTYRWFLAQMMLIIGSFSAFLNNTPLVAVMMPYVRTWSKKNNISPSKLLIPLSYAAILGGCITLIGTSTNLIVNGLVIEQNINNNLKELHFFDFAYVGLPMLIIGTIYILYISPKLLPNKSDIIDEFSDKTREYIVEAEVRPNSHLVGKTIETAGLRNLKGLFLVEIVRDSLIMDAVSPDTIILPGDRLIFAGEINSIADLLNDNNGLTMPQVGMLKMKKHTDFVEIVISHNSSLINKTVKNANFRGKYDSAVVAIHRNGEKISGKIGDIRLKAGDAILLLAGEDLRARSFDTNEFYFISKVREINKPDMWKSILLLGGLGLAIIIAILNILPLFINLLILIIVITAFKIVNPKDIPKYIDYNLAVIIAMSLSLGTAMIKSGTAEMIASIFINIFVPLGTIGLLFGIYFITTILAAYITNKASVAIMFPIVLTLATDLNLNPLPFVLTLTFASAANFMTPIGYQTNLMVYGPGNYSFKDFLKVGAPLTLIYMIVTVLILNYVFL
ncbi:MAG: SLC13 family permease [Marinilabiliales bacterium]